MASLQNREVQLNGTKLSKRDLRKLKKAREKYNLPEKVPNISLDSAMLAEQLSQRGKELGINLPQDSASLKSLGRAKAKEGMNNIPGAIEVTGKAAEYQSDFKKYQEKLDVPLKNDSLLKSELKNEAVQFAQE